MPDLPPIVAAFFSATQTDAVVACFTRDATVRDEHRQHRGIGEIEAWHRDTMARTPFTARPVSSQARDGRLVVSAEVSGAFPGSPVMLDHSFVLRDGLIADLEIG